MSKARSAIRFAPLIPSYIILGIFLAGPIAWALYVSLTNTSLTGENALHPEFIGFGNYTRLLQDSVFPQAIWLTVLFVFMSAIVGQNTLGLTLALMIRNSNAIAKKASTLVVMAMWMLPEIVIAFSAYVFFSTEGTLNKIIENFGFTPVNWLYEHPMLAVIVANIWRGTAFSLMIYQAALDDVPAEITEAAEVDGASGLQRLFKITIPMIKGSITTNLMLITLQTLSVFTLIYTMTHGGPSHDSTTLPLLAYDVAFRTSEIGYGTAISIVIIALGGIFSMVYIKAFKSEGNSNGK
jgi:multiple sugar transport system permease protein